MEDSATISDGKGDLTAKFENIKGKKPWKFKRIIELNVSWLTFFGILLPKLRPNFQFFVFEGFFYTTMIMSEVANLYMNISDIEQLPSASFLLLTHLVQIGKYYQIYRHHGRLLNLIDDIGRVEFVPKTLEQRDVLDGYILVSKISAKIFYSACVATCSFWVVFPFTMKEVNLPLAGWFPWDISSSPAFELTFVYQTIGATLNGLTNVSIDLMISVLIMVVCSQIRILNDSLKNILNFAEMESEIKKDHSGERIKPELQKIMDTKFQDCITHHKCILLFASEVSFIFSKPILGQFIVSIVIICVTLFEMALIPVFSLQFVSLILYLFCMLMEIFLWCYFGNEVTFQSSRLTTWVYCSDWINCSREYRRNLLYLMTRSQRALQLYAGGFFALSLETFVIIVKSAWSYFAVLIQVERK